MWYFSSILGVGLAGLGAIGDDRPAVAPRQIHPEQ